MKLNLEQENKELEKAYVEKSPFNFTRLSDKITGAGLVALIILIAHNITLVLKPKCVYNLDFQ